MDFEVLANLGWREGLIAIIALLVLYVVVVYLRIRRLRRAKAAISSTGLHAVQSAVAAYAEVQGPESITSPEESEKASEFSFPWNEPPSAIPGQPTLEALENEIDQLRKEVGGLRAEVLVLREEQRQEHSKPPVTQNISPLYSEAMQKAMLGQDAASISRDCGISRAEAELVAALVKNRDN